MTDAASSDVAVSVVPASAPAARQESAPHSHQKLALDCLYETSTSANDASITGSTHACSSTKKVRGWKSTNSPASSAVLLVGKARASIQLASAISASIE